MNVSVRDNGRGLREGKIGDGLGTQIVRTLVNGELGGRISWHNLNSGGTEVKIKVPMQFIHQKDLTSRGPGV